MKLNRTTWLMISLALFTLACQSLGSFSSSESEPPERTPVVLPNSAFVPPAANVQVAVGQPLEITSHHVSPRKVPLTEIEIRVNGQALRTEQTASQPGNFPGRFVAGVQVLRDDNTDQIIGTQPELLRPIQENELVGIGQVAPDDRDLSETSQTVTLIWVGYKPGTYDVSLIATDAAGQASNSNQPITQRIEVR